MRAVVGGDGLAVAETGAGSRNIEHLQNLCAEAASEAGVAADRVLICDPSLVVSESA